MAVSSVSDREFSREVLRNDAPVVVAFRAGWCLPSQQIAPFLDDTAARYEGRAKIVSVDVEADPLENSICRQYQVSRLPMVMVFRDGRVADFIGGAASADNVIDMIDRQLRPVRAVDEFNFDAEVLRAQIPVLVFCAAEWCAASREMAPAVEAVAANFRGRANVVRLEYGPANARLCAQYGFARVPTLALFHQGQVQDQIFGQMEGGAKTEAVRASCVGLTTEENIAQMIGRFIL
jgi:thioredoxin 1